MATPPDFTAGQVLTAAQMNAVGLWLVKTQTIGSAVSTVAVTGAFSSDYDNYQITVSGGTALSGQNLTLQLGSTTTGYHLYGYFGFYTGTALTGFNTDNGANFSPAGFTSANSLHMNCYLSCPNLAKVTSANFDNVRTATGAVAGRSDGFLNDTTQYTGFTIGITGGATMTGGTIRVYGYRN